MEAGLLHMRRLAWLSWAAPSGTNTSLGRALPRAYKKAADWLALLLYPAPTKLANLEPGVTPRTYADDLLVVTDDDRNHAIQLQHAWQDVPSPY